MQKPPVFFAESASSPETSDSSRVRGRLFIAIIVLTVFSTAVTVALGFGFLFRLYQTLPSLGQMQNIEQPLVSRVLAKDGTLIHDFSIERRFYVSLKKIPKEVCEAVIATEDRRFYKHWGIDLRRIFGAIAVDVIRGHYAQGASTLTQQLARNVYLTSRSSLIRKIREALTAIQLESCYTKDEILELYLNQVYLGAGVYGVEAASEYYFNKHVEELSLTESALLGGLIQLPEHYRPDRKRNIPRITQRRNTVLKAMLSMKFIDRRTYKEATAQEVICNPKKKVSEVGAYYIEMVRRYIAAKYGDAVLYNGGLTIHTTLNAVAQDSSERSATRGVAVLQGRLNRLFLDSSKADKRLKISRSFFLQHFDSVYAEHEEELDALPDSIRLRKAQISVVALEPSTGAIRVLIGGRSFAESKFNRALNARRQPGSAFKPFVYTAAMDNGFTPASVVLDQPITLVTPEGEWRPENYDHAFNGPVTIRKALAKSINLVAIQVLNKVGAQKVIEYARRMGLKHTMNPVPSLAIGACEATPMEITSAYSVFPNHGIRAKAYCIDKVVDKNGRVLESHTIQEEEAISAPTAYLMCSLMRSVVCCGTAASIRGLGFTRPASGKTGTTNNYSDAWFVGYTPQMACGVWTGVDERRSLGQGVTGSMAAIPVWVKTMTPLHLDLPVVDFKRPKTGIKSVVICEESNLIATSACPKTYVEVFHTESIIDTCNVHGSSTTQKKNMIKLFSAPSPQKGHRREKKKRPLMF